MGYVGLILIVGSLLFLIAAFSPLATEYFPENDPETRLWLLIHKSSQWKIITVLFGAGALFASVGIGLFSMVALTTPALSMVRMLALISGLAAMIGAAPWLVIITHRFSRSPQELIGSGEGDPKLFTTYTLLTQISLVLLGTCLLLGGFSTWVGVMVVTLAALSMLGFALFKDMPPFVHYVPLFIVGLALVAGL
jgi:hypothetical protein